MHEYDVVLKLLLHETADRVLLELAGAPIVQWLNIELPEVQNTRVDLLGVTARGVLIQIEIQTTNDPKMALRMRLRTQAWQSTASGSIACMVASHSRSS